MHPHTGTSAPILKPSPLHLVHLGCVTGAVAGLIESLIVAPLQGATYSAAAAVNTTFFYAVVWGVVGLLVGVLARVAAIRFRSVDSVTAGAFLIVLLPFALVLVHVNITYLPNLLWGKSLAVDAAILVAAVAVFLVFRAVWRRLAARSPGRRRGRRPLMIASVVLVALVAVLALTEGRDDEGATMTIEGRIDGRNVLVLLIDTLRADHLGCYGYDRPTSSFMDELAGEGVVFENAYAQGSRTREATASIVTSYFASTHGSTDYKSILPSSSPTLMQLAKAAGHRTAVVSSNALVSPTFGFGRGVDYFYCHQPTIHSRTLLLQGARRVFGRIPMLKWIYTGLNSMDRILPMRGERYPFESNDPHAMHSAFLSWLDEEPEREFFAYLHYMDPHAPYDPPAPYDTMYDADYCGEAMVRPPVFAETMLPFDEGNPLAEDAYCNLVAHYDGAITYLDDALRDLFAELERRGLMENTLVVLVADHGEEFYDHRGWGHGQSVYNELIHIPLIMRLPGVLPAGARYESTIRQVDLLPTILGAIGVEQTLEAFDFDGVNLWTLVAGGHDDWPEPPVIAEVFHGPQYSRAFKSGDHTLIHAKGVTTEIVMLFDLSADPEQTRDIAESRPDLAASMFAQLQSLTDRARSRRFETDTMPLDEGTREKLRALGYLK
jgi:arylsulfatase A-like enzyme/uncharacterized membrane protein HdeD (DUF308 family)